MSGASKPVTISREVSGPIKLIKYFFPRIRAGLPDYAGSVKMVNGEPPKVIIKKPKVVLVEIESSVFKPLAIYWTPVFTGVTADIQFFHTFGGGRAGGMSSMFFLQHLG